MEPSQIVANGNKCFAGVGVRLGQIDFNLTPSTSRQEWAFFYFSIRGRRSHPTIPQSSLDWRQGERGMGGAGVENRENPNTQPPPH